MVALTTGDSSHPDTLAEHIPGRKGIKLRRKYQSEVRVRNDLADTVFAVEAGQHVAIAPASRERYALVFGKALQKDPSLMDDLIIEAILPSGGISVRRGRGTPCLIPAKSHLVPLP